MKKFFLLIIFTLFNQNHIHAETTRWKGVDGNSWENASNWSKGVPQSSDTVVITVGSKVIRNGNLDSGPSGHKTKQFSKIFVKERATLHITEGGDFQGETWFINGSITFGKVTGLQKHTYFNFGDRGSISITGDFWGNNYPVSITCSLSSSSDTNTPVERKLFTWSGINHTKLGAIDAILIASDGMPLKKLENNVSPKAPGECAILLKNSGLYVHYIPYKQVNSATLIGIGGITLQLQGAK